METCRLCLMAHTQYFSVFSFHGSDTNVATIISKHIGEVSETDPLPKQICSDCWKQIDTFHEFHEKVLAAQSTYLNELIKREQENNFVGVLDPIHVNIDATIEELPDALQSESAIKIEYDACKNTALIPPLISCDVLIDDIDTKPHASQYEGDAFEDENEIEASNYSEDEAQEDNDFVSDEEYDDQGSETPIQPKKKYKYAYNFECDMCAYKTTSKQRIHEHLLRHVKYKCQICSERCYTQSMLALHTRTNHIKDASGKAQDQVMELRKVQSATEEQIEQMLSKYVDTMCDHCNEFIPPSLAEAQEHYEKKHRREGYLKCCSLTLKSNTDISSHVLVHLYPEIFTCCVCGKIGKKKEQFYKHLSRHVEHPHYCQLCNTFFARDDLLDVHTRYYHGPDSIKSNATEQQLTHKLADFFSMQCELCDTQFTAFKEAKQHYKVIHQTTGYLICCGKKFIKAKSVDNHFQWHVNPERNKCEYCGKCFKQNVSFLTHLKRHTQEKVKRFPCPGCSKRFTSRYGLKIHSKVHDETIRKALACPHCDKRYTSQKSLDDHILYIHENAQKGKEMCEFCGKQFMSRSGVQNHVQSVHRAEIGLEDNPADQLNCNICDAPFTNKYRLKKHVDSVHLGQPVKCTLCDKIAPNEPALICHMRSVHVAHSHKCHLCPKTFKAAVALKDHIATHTGAKMYKCSFCVESFIWRPNMYSHQKKAHPEEWKILKSKPRRKRGAYNKS